MKRIHSYDSFLENVLLASELSRQNAEFFAKQKEERLKKQKNTINQNPTQNKPKSTEDIQGQDEMDEIEGQTDMEGIEGQTDMEETQGQADMEETQGQADM